MATPLRYCPSCLSSLRATSSPLVLRTTPFLPRQWQDRPFDPKQTRHASSAAGKGTAGKGAAGKSGRRKDQPASAKKKKAKTSFDQPDLKKAIQFTLVDAMRYLRAAEVGRLPTSSKYELHVRLRTVKNSPIIRNRLILPHPVESSRIAVICPPDSPQAQAALAAGASVVGEETIFDAVKAGRIEFDRCLCFADSLPKLGKSGIARILGPRGLMPSAKTNTVVKDISKAVKAMVGASEYRERMGVVRMGIGQLAFTPEEVQRNISAFMGNMRTDISGLADRVSKEVHEVVLSSTNGPGMSLTGDLQREGGIDVRDISVVN